MNKKGLSKIIIVVIIVAILTISSIVAYVALSGNDNTNTDNSDTTDNGNTDNGGIVDEETDDNEPADNGSTEIDVEGASSMHFKVSVEPADSDSIDYEYMIKNAGTSNVMMRIEMQSAEEEIIYIINGVQEKVWLHTNGEWMELSDLYQSYWDTWSTTWEGYKTSLLDWNGYGDWTYTSQGNTVRIYDITIDPSLSDSLFQH